MNLKIRGIVRDGLLIFVVLVILFVFDVSAVTVTTDTKFAVGNETYTFSHTMYFHTITVGDSYIIFNETGFYISSGNAITITLVYINDDITSAGDGEKVLEFAAETTAGSVVFDLSGFSVGNTYVVKGGGSSIATPTTDGSGFISFTNSVWSSHLFEIFQVGEGAVNSPPVVSGIPDQTITEGATFATINLDNYVTDVDNTDAQMTWTKSGNSQLTVSIVSRVATISIPNVNWNGAETITFRATDPGSLWSQDAAVFTVTAINDAPVVGNIPNQTIAEGSTFTTINLDNYVSDVDNTDAQMTWTYSGNVQLTVSIVNRVATISIPNINWYGVETIKFKATDPSSLWDDDAATFTVTAVNDLPVVSGIPDQTIAEGLAFATINLDDYVTDVDNTDAQMTWTYSGNAQLTVSIVNRVATISTPNSNWYGVETITFTAGDTGGLTDSDDATFTVTASTPPSPPPPSGPPGPPPEIPGDDTQENNPPASPLALSGPTFVEMGVEYGYAGSTTDPDGDQIRYRFDWGDGNFSDWSKLADSGVAASFYHSWTDVDTYQVRAIAQDEHGLNGSWSALLNVTVSGVDAGSEPPVADIGVSGNFSANQTMAFDASGTFVVDGVIVSYFWDFGDGTNGTGISPIHVYTQSGKYTVILTATDNKNNTYSKSMDVTILGANAEANEQKLQDKRFIPAISFTSFIILFTFTLAIFLVVFFRKHINSLVFINGVYLVRRLKLSYAKYKMKRIEAKKAKLGVKIDRLHAALNDGTVVGQVPSRSAGIYYSKMQEDHLRTYESVDLEDESAPEVTSSIDEVRTGETIDKLVKMELAQDTYVEKDARPSIEDVERAIDDFFVQKMREAIDNL